MKTNTLKLIVAILGLLLTTIVNGQEVNLEWINTIGGGSHDSGNSIHVDASGNVYITGSFEDTVDFDPGPAILNLIAVDSSDIFVQKFDPNGNLLWANSIGGSGNDIGKCITTDNAGNVILTGFWGCSLGASVSHVYYGQADLVVSKFNANGNLVWSNYMLGSDYASGNGVKTDGGGNIYVTGHFAGTIDFDPGPGTVNRTSINSSSDIFLLKLTPTGALSWVNAIEGGAFHNYATAIDIDAFGDIYISGDFGSVVDFDSGPGVMLDTAYNGAGIFILKVSNQGNALWVKATDAMGWGLARGKSLTMDSNGNLYLVGHYEGYVDFAPGLDTAFRYPPNGNWDNDYFVLKLDSNGDFLWVKTMDGTGVEGALSVSVDALSNVYWFSPL